MMQKFGWGLLLQHDKVTGIIVIDICLGLVIVAFMVILLWPDIQKLFNEYNDED